MTGTASAKGHSDCNFYPRSPCGERPDIIGHTCNISAFLSTLSLRRATMFFCKPFQEQNQFLSTLSLRRATHFFKPNKSRIRFLSTLSLRRATSTRSFVRYQGYISIHALLAESDHAIIILVLKSVFISIHALLAESDNIIKSC